MNKEHALESLAHHFSNYYTYWVHGIFWLGYWVIQGGVFLAFMSLPDASLLVGMNTVFHAGFAYLNLGVWVRIWLDRKKYVEYAIAVIGSLIVLAWARIELQINVLPTWAQSQKLFEQGSIQHILLTSVSFVIIGIVSTAYKFADDWISDKAIQSKLRQQALEAELKFMKSQVNPHTLFNVLNNVYALCFIQPQKAAEAILQLSELLRYWLDRETDEQVPLNDEWNVLRKYVSLHQLKTEEPRLISLQLHGEPTTWHIAPMLLIPLIENALKHGNVWQDEKGWVQVTLNLTDKELVYEVANTFDLGMQTGWEKEKHIGIENLQKRLDALYPNQHRLEFQTVESIFRSRLVLKRP